MFNLLINVESLSNANVDRLKKIGIDISLNEFSEIEFLSKKTRYLSTIVKLI